MGQKGEGYERKIFFVTFTRIHGILDLQIISRPRWGPTRLLIHQTLPAHLHHRPSHPVPNWCHHHPRWARCTTERHSFGRRPSFPEPEPTLYLRNRPEGGPGQWACQNPSHLAPLLGCGRHHLRRYVLAMRSGVAEHCVGFVSEWRDKWRGQKCRTKFTTQGWAGHHKGRRKEDLMEKKMRFISHAIDMDWYRKKCGCGSLLGTHPYPWVPWWPLPWSSKRQDN